MAARYRTIAGDMVDAICSAHYGAEANYTEAVYAANPGLAAMGPILPDGVSIFLPDLEETTAAVNEAAQPRLWS